MQYKAKHISYTFKLKRFVPKLKFFSLDLNYRTTEKKTSSFAGFGFKIRMA